jgi:hypothetical protein
LRVRVRAKRAREARACVRASAARVMLTRPSFCVISACRRLCRSVCRTGRLASAPSG